MDRWWVCRLLALAGALCIILSACSTGEFLYVDGIAVGKEEMALLDGSTENAVRAKQIQKWAGEKGLAPAFSFGNLMEDMKKENRKRAEKEALGGTIYGVVEYTPLQYYYLTMGKYERLLKNELMKKVDEETLRAYYEAHREQYRQIGLTKARKTVREGNRVIEEGEVQVDRYQVRFLSEEDEQMVSHLLSLKEGGSCTWKDSYGREITLVSIMKTEDSYTPYEEVSGAVLEQYTNELFERTLAQKIAECSVRDERPQEERGNNEK